MAKEVTDVVLVDRLLSFVYPNESEMTDDEVREELRRLGINTDAAMKKVREALRKREASDGEV